MAIKTSDIILGGAVLGALVLGWVGIGAIRKSITELTGAAGELAGKPLISIPPITFPNITFPSVSFPDITIDGSSLMTEGQKIAKSAIPVGVSVGLGATTAQLLAAIPDIMTGQSVLVKTAVPAATSTALGAGATGVLSSIVAALSPVVVGTVAEVDAGICYATPSVTPSVSSPLPTFQSRTGILSTIVRSSTATTVSPAAVSNNTAAAVARLATSPVGVAKGSTQNNASRGTIGTGVNAGYVASGSGGWLKV